MKYSGRTKALSPRFGIIQAIEKIKELGFEGGEVCLDLEVMYSSATRIP